MTDRNAEFPDLDPKAAFSSAQKPSLSPVTQTYGFWPVGDLLHYQFLLQFGISAHKTHPSLVQFTTPRTDIEGSRAAGMKAVQVDELVAVMQPE